jgi:D-inositol-3-phosphate glycosyltransferase
VALRAAAVLVRTDPALAGSLTVAFIGGPSGSGRADPDQLTELAHALGITGLVRLEPPCPQPELADWYRAATVVMVPSYSESFGLVAAEAQACGTPVIAASVGGLRTAVQDGVSGILVDGHDPASYARVLGELFASPGLRARLAHGAVKHASRFGWGITVDRLLTVYAGAMSTSLDRGSYTRAG